MVDYTLYLLILIALGLSLMINVIVLMFWLEKKFPGLIFKEEK